jgi:hypothetical protein
MVRHIFDQKFHSAQNVDIIRENNKLFHFAFVPIISPEQKNVKRDDFLFSNF